jgi:hypothetical protein
MSAQEADAGD